MTVDADRTTGQQARYVPAETGLWVFILGDLALFAVMFGAFMIVRADDVSGFVAGHETMSRTSGALMTLTLLVSSLAVVLALSRIRANRGRDARRLLLVGVGCGALFCALKVIEYHDKVSADHTLNTGQFWAFYFGLTGLHLVHVLLAIAGLMFVIRYTRTHERLSPGMTVAAEAIAIFWHMVDAIWIILFALFYLVR